MKGVFFSEEFDGSKREFERVVNVIERWWFALFVCLDVAHLAAICAFPLCANGFACATSISSRWSAIVALWVIAVTVGRRVVEDAFLLLAGKAALFVALKTSELFLKSVMYGVSHDLKPIARGVNGSVIQFLHPPCSVSLVGFIVAGRLQLKQPTCVSIDASTIRAMETYCTPSASLA